MCEFRVCDREDDRRVELMVSEVSDIPDVDRTFVKEIIIRQIYIVAFLTR